MKFTNIISKSIKSITKNPISIGLNTLFWIISQFLFLGIGLLPVLLIFTLLSTTGTLEPYGGYVLVAVGMITYSIIWMILSMFTGGYVSSLHDTIFNGTRANMFDYIAVSLRRGLLFSGIDLVRVVLTLIIMAPLIAIAISVNIVLINSITLAHVMYILCIFIALIINVIFGLCAPIAATRKLNPLIILRLGIEKIIRNPLDYLLILILMGTLYTIGIIIPIFGWLLLLFVINPLNHFVLIYLIKD